MIRSNALRSTIRSLWMGNGAARHGSTVIVSPSVKCRMCSWHTVVARCGPCATPLMTRLHMPQIPSRQSESNAIGSSPRPISPSFTTSSISRNDMSGDTSVTGYSTILPGAVRLGCRQINSLRFMALTCEVRGARSEVRARGAKRRDGPPRTSHPHAARRTSHVALLVTPLRRVRVLELERLDVLRRRVSLALVLPGGHVREVLVVAPRLVVRRLVLLPEVAAARLAPLPGVQRDQLGEFQVVGDPACVLERLVEVRFLA